AADARGRKYFHKGAVAYGHHYRVFGQYVRLIAEE
ncbi:MAG: hypothetical protein K0Q73_3775, partial [Paenibacillus sp.]|nr:hypothetical protein [Paenibacillus sp.]